MPLLCAEHLRGCVLTTVEGLPARLTVRDVLTGALLHLMQQQQQQQGALFLPMTDWPLCGNPCHRGNGFSSAAAGEAPPGSAAAGDAAAGAASMPSSPFRWTVSAPNYQQTHPLLEQHLSEPFTAADKPSLRSPNRGFLRPSSTWGPLEGPQRPPEDGGLLPTRGDSPGGPSSNSRKKPLQRGPHSGPTPVGAPRGQQFLSLRCGHVVKYLAVALGHADAFLLLPASRAEGSSNSGGAQASCLSSYQQQQKELQQQQEKAEGAHCLEKTEGERGGPSRVEGPLQREGTAVSPHRPLLMVWDHAAGAAVVEMLGGLVLDSNKGRVQGYCYLSPVSADVASPVAVGLPKPMQQQQQQEHRGPPLAPQQSAGAAQHKTKGPHNGELGASAGSPFELYKGPPTAFVLRGGALVAARSAEAAARIFAALKALHA